MLFAGRIETKFDLKMKIVLKRVVSIHSSTFTRSYLTTD